MMEFSIKNTIRVLNANSTIRECVDSIFTGVSIDSRTTKAGDCFFAIAGENFDGHDYVGDAFAKGAVCAVVSKGFQNAQFADKCLVKVDDTVKSLGDLAREYRRRSGLKVVAITGSAGKTTTRHICHHVLSRRFKVHQSPKSFNNNIGVPLTLLGAGADTEIVIAELGSNNPGEIAYLTRVAEPDIAVVTNVHPAHLEGFGDLRTIVKEKSSIAEGLRRDGILIANADFELLIETCRALNAKLMTFGKSDGADCRVSHIRLQGPSSRFTIDGRKMHLPLAGGGNVENALAAWAVCSQLGMTVDEFSAAVETLPPVSMRTELLHIGNLTVLSDCYNANPASMKNALEILAGLDKTGQRRLVFICGDMAELGPQTERLHTELGTFVAGTRVKLMVAVGRLATIAAETAQSYAERQLHIKCFGDTVSACKNLRKLIKDNDIVLVKGSRRAGLETIVEKLKMIYDL
jgi:UDP-N-acetylmuramoyl-tripeptide--D-alanyl-D-alanine ligase